MKAPVPAPVMQMTMMTTTTNIKQRTAETDKKDNTFQQLEFLQDMENMMTLTKYKE